MDNGTRVVNGIILDEYFISIFLDALTKKVNGDNANFILQKLGSGDINFLELLDDIASKKEFERLQNQVEAFKRENKSKQRLIDELKKTKSRLLGEKSVLSNDVHNYISAVRYYEDTLVAMGLRKDILRREDLGEIFADDEDEEAYWE